MIVWLVELLPALKTTGAIQPLRYSSASAWTTADGLQWLPRLSSPYKRSIQVFDGAFSDQPQDYASIEVRTQTGDPVLPVIGVAWDGRRARVWKGAPGLPTSAMTLVYDGECDSVEATKQGFRVNLRGPGFKLTKNMLALYAGSGDAEGTGDLANTPKPMLIGTAVDVPAVYVDKARGIFQYHAYGAGTLAGVFDGGSPLSWDGNNYADYASLKAATIAGGYYTRCDALGMGRHGGTAISAFAVDASGLAPAGNIGYIVTLLGNLAGVPVDATTMAWFDQNLPHPQDNFVSDQTTYEAVLRDMLLKLGGYVCYTADGRLSAGLVRRGAAPSFALGRGNLKSLSIAKTAAPYFRRRMGYQRAWRVHTYAETRTERAINPRGTYVNTNTYSYYDTVNYGSDTWLHKGTADTTGVVPTEGAVWTLFLKSATKTSQLEDDAGLGLTALWPSISGVGKPTDYADKTAVNTAAAIVGQSQWATTPRSVDSVYGAYPNLVYNGGLRIGADGWFDGGMVYNPGSYAEGGFFSVTNANGSQPYLVAQSAIFAAGEGLILTLQLFIFAAGQTAGSAYARIAFFNAAGGLTGYSPNAQAVNGTGWSQYFAYSQAPTGTVRATVQLIVDGNPVTSNTAFRLMKVAGGTTVTPFSDEATDGARYPNGTAIRYLQPQEGGANTTETRVAAAIVNQGGLAVKNKINGNDIETFYNGQGGRVELDGNGMRVFVNNGIKTVHIGF